MSVQKVNYVVMQLRNEPKRRALGRVCAFEVQLSLNFFSFSFYVSFCIISNKRRDSVHSFNCLIHFQSDPILSLLTNPSVCLFSTYSSKENFSSFRSNVLCPFIYTPGLDTQSHTDTILTIDTCHASILSFDDVLLDDR